MYAALLTAALLAPPAVGDDAPDLALKTVDGEEVTLKQLTADGPTVVVVLRGFPGYQCGICRGQFQGFMRAAEKFESRGANVVFVYPGDVADLDAKAKQFLGSADMPSHYKFVLDPGYTFTNAWDLRWDAPRETAYPSSFLVDGNGKVAAANVSKGHGGRVTADQALQALAKL